MDEPVDQLLAEIDDILFELKDISEVLSKLEPVSHKRKSAVVWVGGIPGAVRAIREGNKFDKLVNAPIFKDKSFYNLAFIIAKNAESLSEKQVKIQSLVEKDNSHYYEKV